MKAPHPQRARRGKRQKERKIKKLKIITLIRIVAVLPRSLRKYTVHSDPIYGSMDRNTKLGLACFEAAVKPCISTGTSLALARNCLQRPGITTQPVGADLVPEDLPRRRCPWAAVGLWASGTEYLGRYLGTF